MEIFEQNKYDECPLHETSSSGSCKIGDDLKERVHHSQVETTPKKCPPSRIVFELALMSMKDTPTCTHREFSASPQN